MNKKAVALLLLVVSMGLVFGSCVTQPRFSDYAGYDKDEALSDLSRQKSSNTVRIVLNWLLWGWIGLYIPSIVDTINYVTYLEDFRTVERRIEATPAGNKVGQ
jgi:hypothetical protein